jgi:hypothetical protein
MRFHQSWYRAEVLGVPCGIGPRATSRTSYGNMLCADDAARGLNFTSAPAFAEARARLGAPRVEAFRLLHNLLSSQPMCFNLFGPLARDPDLATRLARATWPWIRRVRAVLLEHAPAPAPDYLGDGTSFDAFLDVEDADGARGFVGIETKLTEPFSPRRYDTPAYRRLSDDPTSPWRPDARDVLPAVAHNQLWRNHLLAVAMLKHRDSPYRRGEVAVVHHPADARCATILAGYAALLRPGHAVAGIALDQLLGTWAAAAPDAPGLVANRIRYVELSRSDAAWRARA